MPEWTNLDAYMKKMDLDPELCKFIDNQKDNFDDKRQEKDMPINEHLKDEILKIVL